MPKSIRDFRLLRQCTKNWCWAAVGASIVEHSNTGQHPTQCEFASKALKGCMQAAAGNCQGACLGFVTCKAEPHLPNPLDAMLDNVSALPDAVAPDREVGPECMERPPFEDVVLEVLSGIYKIKYRSSIEKQMKIERMADQMTANWPVVIERKDGKGLRHVLVVRNVVADRMEIVDSEGFCKTGVHGRKLRFLGLNQPRPYEWIETYYHDDGGN